MLNILKKLKQTFRELARVNGQLEEMNQAIENLEIWHEPLQEVHKSFYATTIIKLALFKFLEKDIRNIDFGIIYKVLDVVSRMIGKIFAKGLISSQFISSRNICGECLS